MTDLRQAAQQALEALIPLANAASPNERECLTDEDHERAAEALEALCAALAEPEQIEDAIVYGSAWSKDGKRIDPMSVYKEPEQEPVAWVDERAIAWLANHPRGKITTALEPQKSFERPMPLYTAPTPRKPLTDEEMRECAQAMNAEPLAEGWPELIKFARAIERAHGIGGQHGS